MQVCVDLVLARLDLLFVDLEELGLPQSVNVITDGITGHFLLINSQGIC